MLLPTPEHRKKSSKVALTSFYINSFLSAPSPAGPDWEPKIGIEEDEVLGLGKYAESGSAGVPCSRMGAAACGAAGALAAIDGRELAMRLVPGRAACVRA